MRIHLILICVAVFLISGCSFYQQGFKPSQSYQNKGFSQTKLKAIAKEWKNTPYVLGGMSNKGSDCSGFTQNVFAQFNIQIPRDTKAQLSSGKKIPNKKDLRTGDLVFFRTSRGPNGMHVGIYLDKGYFIHLSTKGGVKQVSLSDPYWKKRYLGASRYSL